MALASQQLSVEAKGAVKSAVGSDFATISISDKAPNTYSVDENFVPLRSSDTDALVVAEQCVERLRKNRADGEAVVLLAKALADLHSVSNIRINNNDFSNNNYMVRRWNNRTGKYYTTVPLLMQISEWLQPYLPLQKAIFDRCR